MGAGSLPPPAVVSFSMVSLNIEIKKFMFYEQDLICSWTLNANAKLDENGLWNSEQGTKND